MANAFDVDAREVTELAADLGRVAADSLPLVDAVMKRAAQGVKEEMASDAAASRHFGGIGRTISYDSDYRVGQVAYEIGPDRDRGAVAALGVIAYFGGSNGGGGTLDINAPLRAEEPRMLAALDKALADLL
jgi:hypothetical protein